MPSRSSALPPASPAWPIEIETPRLRLRAWHPDDLAPFAALNADPRVMQHFPALLDRAASDAMARHIARTMWRRGWGLWALALRGGGFVGFAGLSVPTPEMPFGPCVEIGWRLARAHWGRGLATEAAQAALAFGFSRLGLGEIVSFTALGNLRSQAVMQRLGMQPECDFDHPRLLPGHTLCRHRLYRLRAPGADVR